MTTDTDNIYNQSCNKCPLSLSRTKVVWYRGNTKSNLALVGEAPGKQEDLQGRPFVGRSGALLDEALLASFGPSFMDYVYITNMVKCRPPQNRRPRNEEINACSPFLIKELDIVGPRLLVLLGKVAAEQLLQRPVKITEEHGTLDSLGNGQLVMVCYHPAYVLRNSKPEIKNSFFQAFVNARRTAYEPDSCFELPTRSAGRAYTSPGKLQCGSR